jgi:hypothetical protein
MWQSPPNHSSLSRSESMRAPSDQELLDLWDRCLQRHPIDRSLALCAWAAVQPSMLSLADQPLGAITITLLQLRRVCFGPSIDAHVHCPACGEPLGLRLDVDQMLAGVGSPPVDPRNCIGGLSLRAVTSRDLAAVSDRPDPDSAARALLERCLIDPEGNASAMVEKLSLEQIEALEAGLEAMDPAADISLQLTCGACGHSWLACLDIGGVLWEELTARARNLLADVAALARAYGWSEQQILALPSRRRTAYLELASP